MNSLVEKFAYWLYLPVGYTALISRLTGLLAILITPSIWWWSHGGCGGIYPKPYNIPTWLTDNGTALLTVPMPPEVCNNVIFSIYLIGAFALIFGVRRRSLYIYMAAVIFYYCSRDWLIACFHWIILPFCFLLALALDNSQKKLTPTRRLIQVAIVSCYLLGVLQKLSFPDFWQGYSFSSFFSDGFAANEYFQPIFASLKMPHVAWQGFSIMILVLETVLAIGLCFARTRLFTAFLGICFHGGIMATMDVIIGIFSLVMWTGYLAFFDKRKAPPAKATTDAGASIDSPAAVELADPPRPLNMVLSVSFIALMLVMPLRIYLPGGPSNDVLTLFDRTPWTYGMFIMRQKVAGVSIAVTEAAATQVIKPIGRMLECSTVNDMIAAIDYAKQLHPNCTQAKVQTIVIVNQRRNVLKEMVWQKAGTAGAAEFTRSAQVIDDGSKDELLNSWGSGR